MPDIFDRLGSFFRSIFSEDESADSSSGRRFHDADMQDAWDELEDYLNEGKTAGRKREQRHERTQTAEQAARFSEREKLRPDYANLKVPFGSSFEAVKQAYKKLLRQYHPDKHANDPQKFKMATEITSKLNQSFQRIREYEEKR